MPKQLKDASKVVGAKQTMKALQAGQTLVVYIARDAEPDVILPIQRQCAEQGVEVVEVETMAELGKACSIDVGASVAGIVK